MFNGYVPLRRGIAEHVRDGRLSHLQAAAYLLMILEADHSTGTWIGSAKALEGAYGFASATARWCLEELARKGYIKRFSRPGKHGNYPIVINKYAVKVNSEEWRKVNAEASILAADGSVTIVYEPVEVPIDVPIDVPIKVPIKVLGPFQEEEEEEVRTRAKNQTKNQTTLSLSRKRDEASSASPLFGPSKEYAFEGWKAKFGQAPTWSAKDFSGLSRLLKSKPTLTLDEFKSRWTHYLADADPFVAKQGHSLAFFCSRFDSYITAPAPAGMKGPNNNGRRSEEPGKYDGLGTVCPNS